MSAMTLNYVRFDMGKISLKALRTLSNLLHSCSIWFRIKALTYETILFKQLIKNRKKKLAKPEKYDEQTK